MQQPPTTTTSKKPATHLEKENLLLRKSVYELSVKLSQLMAERRSVASSAGWAGYVHHGDAGDVDAPSPPVPEQPPTQATTTPPLDEQRPRMRLMKRQKHQSAVTSVLLLKANGVEDATAVMSAGMDRVVLGIDKSPTSAELTHLRDGWACSLDTRVYRLAHDGGMTSAVHTLPGLLRDWTASANGKVWFLTSRQVGWFDHQQLHGVCEDRRLRQCARISACANDKFLLSSRYALFVLENGQLSPLTVDVSEVVVACTAANASVWLATANSLRQYTLSSTNDLHIVASHALPIPMQNAHLKVLDGYVVLVSDGHVRVFSSDASDAAPLKQVVDAEFVPGERRVTAIDCRMNTAVAAGNTHSKSMHLAVGFVDGAAEMYALDVE